LCSVGTDWLKADDEAGESAGGGVEEEGGSNIMDRSTYVSIKCPRIRSFSNDNLSSNRFI